ncbi:DUF3103 family protein [Streptomyces chryseus]
MSNLAFRATVPLAVSGAMILGAIGAASASAAAEPAQTVSAGNATQTVASTTDQLAKQLAAALGSKAAQGQARQAVTKAEEAMDLFAFTRQVQGLKQFQKLAVDGNTSVQRTKGLKADAGSLLELRLGDESMREKIRRGDDFLIAGEASEDATVIKAYDSKGRVHKLDAHTTPDHPVLVVGINGEQALKVGMQQMRANLNKLGISAQLPTDVAKPARTASSQLSGGFDSTRIEQVHLKDDLEPWHKGAAEIYALVAGVNAEGQPQLDTIQMPYLDRDNQTYRPRQILINWSHFKFNAADVVMMEEDDDTNYTELAAAIAQALLTIVKEDQYVPLVDAIIKAIPQEWFTDDHDYVDSWYTIQKNALGLKRGASNNGTMDFAPFYVDGI